MSSIENDRKRKQLLPSTQTQLCFDKNDFVKKEFCVDQFVARCRRRVSLETLRENLEMYFKLLKNAMIELINKDYADFVNLSSNLVGMDESIEALREPLLKINSIIEETEAVMDANVNKLESALKEENEFKKRKKLLTHMKGLIEVVEKIEHIQNSEELKIDQISERIAGDFNKLQHHADFCKHLPVLTQMKPRITEITAKLQRSLERELIEGIIDGDAKKIHRCLNSYALIGKVNDAEALVRKHIINPHLEQIMLEFNGDISNLKVLLSRILDFLSHNLKFICDITSGRKTKNGLQFRGILGYDFIVNSAWPSIVSCFENNLPELFASEDSDLFHQRYHQCMKFVENVERLCGSQASVRRLRDSEAFHNLNTHWSLPMYFQIRFQKIVQTFVTCLSSPTAEPADDSVGFRLNVSYVTWVCIETCWKDEVFINSLIHRFWKLTLQLISRYETWVNQTLSNDNNKSSNHFDINNLASLIHDVDVLHVKVNYLYENVVEPLVLKQGLKNCSILKEALKYSFERLLTKKKEMSEKILSDLIEQSIKNLKQAQDVPRLFRKTNRSKPTDPSPYVAALIKPCASFYSLQSTYMESSLLSTWLNQFTVQVSIKSSVRLKKYLF